MALPIFPVRLQTSIVGRSELNFRVRNGNGWTLALISTNFVGSSRARAVFAYRFAAPPLPRANASLVCARNVYAIRHIVPINNYSILLSQRLSVKIVVTRTGFEPMLTA